MNNDLIVKIDDNVINEILIKYQKGHAIFSIASDVGFKNTDVLIILNQYKDSCKINKIKYNENLKKVIANRNSCEVSGENIMKELGISRTMIRNSVEKYGTLPFTLSKNTQEDVEVERLFDTGCPLCGSKKINPVSTVLNGMTVDGEFCMDCNSEFVFEDDKIFKLRWEYTE